MAKMGIARSDKGCTNETSTPVSEKGNGPCSLRHTQSSSCCTSAGTWPTGQTIDISTADRVAEKNSPCNAHPGTAAHGSRRHTANLPGTREKRKLRRVTLKSSPV